MENIVQIKNPVLRKKAKEVPPEEIGSEKINKILKQMEEAVDACPDGVAIAAPQIGESLRIFLVSGRTLDLIEGKKEETGGEKDLSTIGAEKPEHKPLVFINPKIVKLSSKKILLEEGCLSVRGVYGKVKRSTNATIEAYDEHGKKFTRGAGGLLAEIFQHETDHLNGVLFVDTAKDLFKLEHKKKNGE